MPTKPLKINVSTNSTRAADNNRLPRLVGNCRGPSLDVLPPLFVAAVFVRGAPVLGTASGSESPVRSGRSLVSTIPQFARSEIRRCIGPLVTYPQAPSVAVRPPPTETISTIGLYRHPTLPKPAHSEPEHAAGCKSVACEHQTTAVVLRRPPILVHNTLAHTRGCKSVRTKAL
jgi:hypothetical protein